MTVQPPPPSGVEGLSPTQVRARLAQNGWTGALPIHAGEDVIGAIGVSGAPGGEKDEACAKAGIDKVADGLK